jgi:transposase
MGRSRGGLTTKIHALVDTQGRPIRRKLTEGQAHDGRTGDDMLDTIEAGNIRLAGRGHDSDRPRDDLKDRGAWGNIRPCRAA